MNDDKKKSQSAAAKPKTARSGMSGRQLGKSFHRAVLPVVRHGQFIFIVVIVLGLAACTYLASQVFVIDKDAYRLEKTIGVKRSYELKENETVADEVLSSQTAGAGPIRPNYQPERDNPFVEE